MEKRRFPFIRPICQHCTEKNLSDARFCDWCGKPLPPMWNLWARLGPRYSVLLAGLMIFLCMSGVPLALLRGQETLPALGGGAATYTPVLTIAAGATNDSLTATARTLTTTPQPTVTPTPFMPSVLEVRSAPIASEKTVPLPIESLDGRFLLLSQRLGSSRLFLAGDDESIELLLNEEFVSFSHPVWSPDGTIFGFAGVKRGARDIYIGTVGGEYCQLTHSSIPSSYPVWSPDGAQIAYLEGHQARIVTSNCNQPDNDEFLRIYSKIRALDWSSRNILALVIHAGDTRTLLFHDLISHQTGTVDLEGIVTSPRWDPTGDRVAFILEGAGGKVLYILDWSDAVVTAIVRAEHLAGLSWSPSGDALIFTSDRSGSWSLFLYDVNTQFIRPVATDVTEIRAVSWGP